MSDALCQFLQYGSPLFFLYIDREAALVAIEPNITRRKSANHRIPAANNVTDSRSFDFDHLCAHIREETCRKRTGKHLLKRQDLDAVQRTHGFSIDRHLNLSYRLERFELLERLERTEGFKKVQAVQIVQAD